jgi:hypothetical protein
VGQRSLSYLMIIRAVVEKGKPLTQICKVSQIEVPHCCLEIYNKRRKKIEGSQRKVLQCLNFPSTWLVVSLNDPLSDKLSPGNKCT